MICNKCGNKVVFFKRKKKCEKIISNYLSFFEFEKEKYNVVNVIKKDKLGIIKKNKVGRWNHWCFFPEQDTYYSNGCLKEITKFITSLYTKKVDES